MKEKCIMCICTYCSNEETCTKKNCEEDLCKCKNIKSKGDCTHWDQPLNEKER